MEAVAEHINEMQKIYEEYGCYFEEIVRVNKESRKGKVIEMFYEFLYLVYPKHNISYLNNINIFIENILKISCMLL